MNSDKFDLKSLQTRIQEIQKEKEETSYLTHDFIKCLFERHNLHQILSEEQTIEDVPDSILGKLKKGQIPEREELAELDNDSQDTLIKELVWICGLGAIAWHSENWQESGGEGDSPFQVIISMCDVDEAHFAATYIIAAFTLLMGHIPSSHMIELVTNNYDSSDESMNSTLHVFNELCISILSRYNEDRDFYEH